MQRVIVSGLSARALAGAAAKAGWAPIVLDAFGDLDCVGTVYPISPYSPRRALQRARSLTADAVAVSAGWEHAPAALDQLADGRLRLAAPSDAIRQVRDPVRLARLLRAAGLPSLVTAAAGKTSPPYRLLSSAAAHAIRAWSRQRAGLAPRTSAPADGATAWRALVKPVQGGGGRQIVPFQPDAPAAARGRYLQEWRNGVDASVIMATNGRTGVPLALSRQLTGVSWLGAAGATYAGSVMAGAGALSGIPHTDPRLRASLESLADLLGRTVGLAGLVGADGIIDADGTFWLIEVNPRWCASFELLDRLLPTALFTHHARACAGTLPRPWLGDDAHGTVLAKGVLYRDANIPAATAPDFSPCLAQLPAGVQLADVPHAGTSLRSGAPICTVIATAADEGRALALLEAGTRTVRGALGETMAH